MVQQPQPRQQQQQQQQQRKRRGKNFDVLPRHDDGRCKPCHNWEKKGCCYIEPHCHYCHHPSHHSEGNDLEQVQSAIRTLTVSTTHSRPAPAAPTAAPRAASASNFARECQVCFEEMTEIYSMVPCGHAACCLDCIKQQQLINCPFCRQRVQGVMKIHL